MTKTLTAQNYRIDFPALFTMTDAEVRAYWLELLRLTGPQTFSMTEAEAARFTAWVEFIESDLIARCGPGALYGRAG